MRHLIFGNRTTLTARWAADGGNGSVVYVEDMTNEEYAKVWEQLKAVLKAFDGYSIDCGVIFSLMCDFEEQIQ
jgi:hypothetical protein